MELIDYAHLKFQTSPVGLTPERRIIGPTKIERIAAVAGYAISTSDGLWDFSVVVRDDGKLINGYSQPRRSDHYEAPIVTIQRKDLPGFAGLVLDICQHPLENIDTY